MPEQAFHALCISLPVHKQFDTVLHAGAGFKGYVCLNKRFMYSALTQHQQTVGVHS